MKLKALRQWHQRKPRSAKFTSQKTELCGELRWGWRCIYIFFHFNFANILAFTSALVLRQLPRARILWWEMSQQVFVTLRSPADDPMFSPHGFYGPCHHMPGTKFAIELDNNSRSDPQRALQIGLIETFCSRVLVNVTLIGLSVTSQELRIGYWLVSPIRVILMTRIWFLKISEMGTD